MTNRNVIKYNMKEEKIMDYEKSRYKYSFMPSSRCALIKTMYDNMYDIMATTFYPDEDKLMDWILNPLASGEDRLDKIFGNAKRILSELIEMYPNYRKKLYHKEDVSDDELNLHLMKYEPKFFFDNTMIDADLIAKMEYTKGAIISLQVYLYDFMETLLNTVKQSPPHVHVHIFKGEIEYLEEMLEILRKVVSITIVEILPCFHSEWFVQKRPENWMDGGIEFSWIETVQHRLGIIQCWIYEMKAHDPYSEESRQDLIHRTDDILYDLDYTAAIKEKYNGKRSI
jgi:hypothetical protein